ncbi:class A beta-lactamase-related serine hydrolase [Nonomuraea sp. NBC_01738]|uniref:serine hydrolase n=1 Tax=Nonomuraea sp. NBC_01738 TaxID=2976003 RepID=UPI002E1469FE|nr:class A beta-lactamase-related serine hydrolase [Nonomuraea sp. NBC_01738]
MRAVRWGLGLVAVGLLGAGGCGTEQRPVAVAPHVHAAAAPCVLKFLDRKSGAAAEAALRKDINRYLARQSGRVVFSAHDLVTGLRLGYKEHENGMITASGAKVDILTALMLRRTKLGGGESDLANRMIRESDNSAADALWWRVGAGGGMSQFYRRMGLTETVPGPSRYWGGTNTSPADRIRLLRLLVEGGHGLVAADRELILGLMGRVQRDQAWGVSAAARPGDHVALKNGWTPRPFIHNTWAVTSYGRVRGPGRDLLLSVQTDLQPGEGSGIAAIEGLAKLIGTRLDGLRPTLTRPCTRTTSL